MEGDVFTLKIRITCDLCQESWEDFNSRIKNIRVARKALARYGWNYRTIEDETGSNKMHDLCPKCSEMLGE